MNKCKHMDKKCEYADRLGMCENLTATCARSRTMSRLIDADALMDKISVFLERNEDLIDPSVADCIEEIIEQDESVDAVEVVHGEWEFIGGYGYQYRCSNCIKCAGFKTPYCPNCGAKMDGEEKDNADS